MKLLISSNRIGKQYYDNVFVSDEYFSLSSNAKPNRSPDVYSLENKDLPPMQKNCPKINLPYCSLQSTLETNKRST